jgi:prepilin signal peptidase PulO-like enzyme (type II secretory pathway)
MIWILFALFAALGACLASFVNVAAHRSVTGECWWGRTRSRCDSCGVVLNGLDLVPLLSFLLSKGRCRHCGAPIGYRYPLVEIVGAAMAGALYLRWGLSPALPLALLVAFGFLLNALTDIESGYVFDFFAGAIGVAGMLFRIQGGWSALLDGLWGALLGGGIILCIIIVSRGGMGWGDATLAAGAGAALGMHMIGVVLYLGFMIGGLVALVLLLFRRVSRKDAIPLVPFLAAGGFAALLAGPRLLSLISLIPGWPWR